MCRIVGSDPFYVRDVEFAYKPITGRFFLTSDSICSSGGQFCLRVGTYIHTYVRTYVLIHKRIHFYTHACVRTYT